jgi:hypothetical protein
MTLTRFPIRGPLISRLRARTRTKRTLFALALLAFALGSGTGASAQGDAVKTTLSASFDITLSILAVSDHVVVTAADGAQTLQTVGETMSVVSARDLDAREIFNVADALRAVPGLRVCPRPPHRAACPSADWRAPPASAPGLDLVGRRATARLHRASARARAARVAARRANSQS